MQSSVCESSALIAGRVRSVSLIIASDCFCLCSLVGLEGREAMHFVDSSHMNVVIGAQIEGKDQHRPEESYNGE